MDRNAVSYFWKTGRIADKRAKIADSPGRIADKSAKIADTSGRSTDNPAKSLINQTTQEKLLRKPVLKSVDNCLCSILNIELR